MICARSIDLMCNMTHEADSKKAGSTAQDGCNKKSCLFRLLIFFNMILILRIMIFIIKSTPVVVQTCHCSLQYLD